MGWGLGDGHGVGVWGCPMGRGFGGRMGWRLGDGHGVGFGRGGRVPWAQLRVLSAVPAVLPQVFVLLFIFVKRQIMRFAMKSRRGPHVPVGQHAPKVGTCTSCSQTGHGRELPPRRGDKRLQKGGGFPLLHAGLQSSL